MLAASNKIHNCLCKNPENECPLVTKNEKLNLRSCEHIPGVRFSGRPVANGTQKWLWATLIFDYSGPNGDSTYLRSFNILDATKMNGILINISEVLSWLYRIYVNHKSCVCDTLGIARNVAKQ